MRLTGDYHTHTTYSHGKGTVFENARRAQEIGLRELAVTDHGFGQMAFGLRHKRLPSLIRDCRAAEKETGVRVLVGVEANLLGESGLTDLCERDYPYFDVFLMGIHRFVRFKPFCTGMWNIFFMNWWYSVRKKEGSDRLMRYNTKALINSIQKYPLDAITHLNYLSFCDVTEVAKAARDYGTYIELNTKKVHLQDDELAAVCDTGVRFIIDSDAHTPERVGETSLIEQQLARVQIPEDRIDNINGRTPKFRFQEYKERNL